MGSVILSGSLGEFGQEGFAFPSPKIGSALAGAGTVAAGSSKVEGKMGRSVGADGADSSLVGDSLT